MADIKISQLSEAVTLSDNDVLPEVSNGVTLKAKAKTIKDYIIGTVDNSDLGATVSAQIKKLSTMCKVLKVEVASFNSLPQTISNANIESDMVCINSELGTPNAQTGDWTITTGNGTLTISGTISGSTTLTMYLINSR